jgi:halimadienyl-diphosphate synthase
MIVPLLLDRAFELGAIQRRSDKYLSSAYPLQQYYYYDSFSGQRRGDEVIDRLQRGKAKKLASLPDGVINRFVTTAFSAEMVGKDGQHLLDVENLQEANGSVGCSPSATAYFALQVSPGDEAALKYLRDVADRNDTITVGGIPEIAPFDVFEIGWALWNLALIDELDDDIKQLCHPHLDFLMDAWTPGKGVGFSAAYTPTDGDDTCMVYETLSRYGRPVDIDAVINYEKENHFRCYDLELNPSIGVNIHVLGALRQAGFEAQHPSVRKVVKFLRQNRILDTFWVDKWQISPYYATSQMIIAAAGFVDDVIEDAIYWIFDTQKQSGAWGYFNPSAEETANCLQALFIWQRHGGKVSNEVLKRGLDWLLKNAENCHEPFWVCKSLYAPELIVRSIILSALMLGSHLY